MKIPSGNRPGECKPMSRGQEKKKATPSTQPDFHRTLPIITCEERHGGRCASPLLLHLPFPCRRSPPPPTHRAAVGAGSTDARECHERPFFPLRVVNRSGARRLRGDPSHLLKFIKRRAIRLPRPPRRRASPHCAFCDVRLRPRLTPTFFWYFAVSTATATGAEAAELEGPLASLNALSYTSASFEGPNPNTARPERRSLQFTAVTTLSRSCVPSLWQRATWACV
ncbi:hypothetical protein SKAU_G00372480 [Synaphobranchus kaupii]|uniref:Uncharacterized protein n=1 Tax=Synaphobranchus kaupii TaxID=118154 RepID=A0A9Q1IFY5_SYNKA|nr:hypothetical protein SKAU_G00372480 [Synaphobranchus kaupii]